MEPTFVTIRYARTFPYPMDPAYAWLTDYQDDDPQRTTKVVKRRPVLERHADRVVMEGELELMGKGGTGVVEVRLHPPDHWVAEIVKGRGRGSIYDYKLTPIPGGCRLDVEYRVRVKRWSARLLILLARPVVRREIATMWDGFADAMAREIPTAPRAAAAP